jgi:hypothetical protein
MRWFRRRSFRGEIFTTYVSGSLAEWGKIRAGQYGNAAHVRTCCVNRYMQRALSREMDWKDAEAVWKDAEKLVPQAEAHIDRIIARLSRRYPMLAAAPLTQANSGTALSDLTARVNAVWQRGTGTLRCQNDRGEMEIVEPTGRRLLFAPDRNYPEWRIVIEVNNPKDTGKFGAARRRLYLTRKDASRLVAEVKKDLGVKKRSGPPPVVLNHLIEKMRKYADKNGIAALRDAKQAVLPILFGGSQRWCAEARRKVLAEIEAMPAGSTQPPGRN